MRIVHLLENLNMGGAERVVIDLVREQQRGGHDCAVICLFQPGAMAHELMDAGIPVTALYKSDGPSPGALRRLRQRLREHRAEVLHSHNAMAHYYGVLASVGMRLARINTRHGMGTLLGNWRQQLLYRLAMHLTDRACFVCNAARQRFIQDGLAPAEKSALVYNGIDTEKFTGGGRPGALHQLLDIAPSARLLVSVGRLNPAKNHPLLVEAFARLAARYPDLHLVLIGDGAGMSALKDLRHHHDLQERIHLPGARDDVPALLADAELFVLSSLTEGFSLSLLEAGAAGLPVVTTDVGGNGEIIADHERGLLVPSADATALATAIAVLLDAPAQAASFAGALQQWVLDHCTLSVMAASYTQIYQEARA
jgi:glycosyltransferase involved in cell wall biosynthesis